MFILDGCNRCLAHTLHCIVHALQVQAVLGTHSEMLAQQQARLSWLSDGESSISGLVERDVHRPPTLVWSPSGHAIGAYDEDSFVSPSSPHEIGRPEPTASLSPSGRGGERTPSTPSPIAEDQPPSPTLLPLAPSPAPSPASSPALFLIKEPIAEPTTPFSPFSTDEAATDSPSSVDPSADE